MPWQIHLVRHAIAAERGPAWPDDALRPLTPHGIERFRRAARGVVRYGAAIEQVLSSPLTRARQTADLLARAAGVSAHIAVMETLAPGHPSRAVVEELFRTARPAAIALVGHEPDLGRLAAYLLGAATPVPFKKGGMCRIDLPDTGVPPRGTLIWCMAPRVLRMLQPRPR